MKIVALILMMLSVQAQADIEIRISDMDYRWGNTADYPVTAIHLGYTHWFYNTGLRIEYGESDKSKNIKEGRYEVLSGQMKDFWVFSLYERLPINQNITVEVGIHYTEYIEEISSPGYQHNNLDTDFGWGAGIEYKLSESFSIKWSFDDYYNKYKEGLGLESTRGESLSLIYKN